jgi:hypothetical protein
MEPIKENLRGECMSGKSYNQNRDGKNGFSIAFSGTKNGLTKEEYPGPLSIKGIQGQYTATSLTLSRASKRIRRISGLSIL